MYMHVYEHAHVEVQASLDFTPAAHIKKNLSGLQNVSADNNISINFWTLENPEKYLGERKKSKTGS